MSDSATSSATLREALQQLAPGTALRDGLERVQRGRTGALIVLGDADEVISLCDGGIEFDVPFAPTRLRELSKMDGAVILSTDGTRIRRANVQLMPAPTYPTNESGMRHRTAERTALQSGRPVIAVSQSMNVITLYVEGMRRVLVEPEMILTRANQAIATLERYRSRLDVANQRLFVSEVNNYATVADAVNVLQRELLVKRVALDIDEDVLELGTSGRQLDLQLTELRGDNDREIEMLLRDYLVSAGPPSDEAVAEALASLDELPDADLLKPANVARILGLPATEESLSQWIVPRGYRVLARIPRVQMFLMNKIIAVFDDLKALLKADEGDIAAVDNVGELWARHVHEGLGRLRR
ncbi:DNA integrity scanning diadenylate cyclase DisA [Corynebacterium halotolerans]|uniref:DNA integrity scanning protein DisA n=1 Tax=Corynebacterium halotolerans YIM 70093 = DSM 44683 TaxID=1121362 RepID=M1P0W5_9CORY|nr:DNA integrity scanning diadenylate cyclase DisA [Corynebacterium halotolerans]AGF73420.1 DNA integrity scanning protein DisA [Corynebacterium halotolerans YIM 70093 = DSM 44683]